MSCDVSWKSVNKQFGISITEFHRHKKAVEKEAGISHLLEAGKARDVESEILSQIEKRQAGSTRAS